MPSPPPLEPDCEAYEAECRSLYRQGARAACLLALPLVPLFGLLDWALFPQSFQLLVDLRFVCVVILVLIHRILRTPFGERRSLALGVVTALVLGTMIDLMTAFTGGAASPYYAGVNLVMVGVALLMPWPPAWTFSTCAVMIAGYVLGAIGLNAHLDVRLLVSNLFFMGSTAGIAITSSVMTSRRRWADFYTRSQMLEAVRHKSEFMAKMSHELRTPIHVMIGYADILLEEALDAGGDAARQLVERMRGHGTLLHRLISDLLDFAKIEAGKMEVQTEPVAMREVIEQVAEGFRPLTDRKGLRLRVFCEDGLPELASDREKIQQVLRNLVGNAVKFTDRGEVAIEVRRSSVGRDRAIFAHFTFLDDTPAAWTAASANGDGDQGVTIFVQDTGIGIRSNDVVTLAGDFRQVDQEAAAKYGGTGLGLSISKRLVHLLGGRIGVRSRYRSGTTFMVYLPAQRGAAAPPAAKPAEPTPISSAA